MEPYREDREKQPKTKVSIDFLSILQRKEGNRICWGCGRELATLLTSVLDWFQYSPCSFQTWCESDMVQHSWNHLWRLRQEDLEFGVSPRHIHSLSQNKVCMLQCINKQTSKWIKLSWFPTNRMPKQFLWILTTFTFVFKFKNSQINQQMIR